MRAFRFYFFQKNEGTFQLDHIEFYRISFEQELIQTQRKYPNLIDKALNENYILNLSFLRTLKMKKIGFYKVLKPLKLVAFNFIRIKGVSYGFEKVLL